MITYRFAVPEDRQDIIDFIDMVFSIIREPNEFESMLPKVYGREIPLTACHALALEDGRIRGCVALWQTEPVIAGHRLKMGYVGSVSAHPTVRGQGVMKRLMQMIIDRAREEKLDLLVLGGNRQRYGYYGFSPCSQLLSYGVWAHNIRHAMKDVATDGIRIVPLEEKSMISEAFSLYASLPVTGARTEENFAAVCRSYGHRPYAVLRDGVFAGWLCANGSGDEISEIVLKDTGMLRVVLKSWFGTHDFRHMEITVHPWDIAMQRELSAFAEGYSMYRDEMMLCLEPANVLRACLKLKNSLMPLLPGRMILSLTDPELRLKLEVSAEGSTSVTETEETPDVTMSGKEAITWLLGAENMPWISGTPAGWFPLPFCVPVADRF